MSDNRTMAKGSERRDERITIRIPASLRAALEREAERQRRTVSDVIIFCCEQGMSKTKGTKR